MIINVKKLSNPEYYKILEPRPDINLVLKKIIVFLTNSVEDPNNKFTTISLL